MKRNKQLILWLTLLLALALTFGYQQPAQAQTDVILSVPNQYPTLQDAVDAAPAGAVVELSAGTYPAPTVGWQLGNRQTPLTIRAAAGATVIFDGQKQHPILALHFVDPNTAPQLVFENITFANGYSTQNGVAAGVTLDGANAVFVNATFVQNRSDVDTVGGAVTIFGGSTVLFEGTVWQQNVARFGGGALGIRGDAKVYIHAAKFIGNSVAENGHSAVAGGGAINAANTRLRISDSLFQDNRAGAFGGGLYVLGSWGHAFETDVIVSNTRFENNTAYPASGVVSEFPSEGGAINIEDYAKIRIFDSTLVGNQSMIGGGVNSYRAQVEIDRTYFVGNSAIDPTQRWGWGGTINIGSNDLATEGTTDYRVASLVLSNSRIVGRSATVPTTANASGGCISANGDFVRQDGNADVIDIGAPAEHRALVQIENTEISDCVVYQPLTSKIPLGGAIFLTLADLQMHHSVIRNSVVSGTSQWGGGGALAMIERSTAYLQDSAFIGNQGTLWGGAISAVGSDLVVDGSVFDQNDISPNVTESYYASLGAAIYTSPDYARNFGATGVVRNSSFQNNLGVTVFDDDRQFLANQMVYANNQFDIDDLGGWIYSNSISGPRQLAGLNSLTIPRTVGNTQKTTLANLALTQAAALPSPNFVNLPTTITPPSLQMFVQNAASALSVTWDSSGDSLETVILPLNQTVIQQPVNVPSQKASSRFFAYQIFATGGAVSSATPPPLPHVTEPYHNYIALVFANR
jgi:hypothetical protein